MEKWKRRINLVYWKLRRRIAGLRWICIPFSVREQAFSNVHNGEFTIFEDDSITSAAIEDYISGLEEISVEVWNSTRQIVMKELICLSDLNEQYHQLNEEPEEVPSLEHEEVEKTKKIRNNRELRRRNEKIVEMQQERACLWHQIERMDQKIAEQESIANVILKKKADRCQHCLNTYFYTIQRNYTDALYLNSGELVQRAASAGYGAFYEGYKEVIMDSRRVLRTVQI